MSWLEHLRARRWAVFVAAILLAAFGVYRALSLPSAVFPSVTFPIVKVITDVGEEPAARMMPTVTRPLEEAILRVPGIDRVISTTSRGSTEMSALFRWGEDMQVALQRVQAETERVRPTLPAGAHIDVEWMNPATFPIEGYALTSDTRSQAELWDLAQYTLKPELVRIPGVSQVQIQGGRQKEFQVQLDPAALVGFRMTAADVVQALQAQDLVESAGLHEANHELYLTLVDGRASSLDAIEHIAVSTPGGIPVPLTRLGRVVLADEVSYVRTTAQGRPAVLLNIVRQPSANTVAIADAVDQLLRRSDLLPKDVRWTQFYDQARFIRSSVNGVRDALLIGVGLAALVLLLFLRSFRLMLIAAVTIPLTAAICGLLLDVTGQTINLMTLAGLAASLGLIADDAIVVIENIARHRERGSPDAAAVGLREILPALIASSLGSITILLPFALLTGVTGAFFKPVALTLGLALAISWSVSAGVVPLLVRRHEVQAKRRRPGRARRRLRSLFRRGVRAFVRWPLLGTGCAVALLAGAWLLYAALGTDFLPAMDEGSIILDYFSPAGTSLSDTDAMLRNAEKEILATPDVLSYSRRTGTQLGFFITEPNRGDFVIDLKPRGERRDVDDVIEDLRTRIARVAPGLHTDFGQLLEDNIGDLTGGAAQPIDVKLFGLDEPRLEPVARQVAATLEKVDGVADVFDGITIAGPALDFRVDPSAAARIGLDTGAIHDQVEPFVEGTVVHPVQVGERMFDLRVKVNGVPLEQIPIRGRTPTTALVPLSAVASVRTGPPEAEIDRENLKTFIGVTARLEGRDLGSAVQEIRQRLARVTPSGVRVVFGGQYEQQQSAFQALLYVLIAAVGLVGLVTLFAYGTVSGAIAVCVVALASLTGVFGALLLTGTTLNISSYVGAIMMVGIVSENAIFVIHEARLLRTEGHGRRYAVIEAVMRRARPVAMTILATACALAPLAFGLGAGAQLVRPLAIAIIGGFTLSGSLVLFVLPSLYRLRS